MLRLNLIGNGRLDNFTVSLCDDELDTLRQKAQARQRSISIPQHVSL